MISLQKLTGVCVCVVVWTEAHSYKVTDSSNVFSRICISIPLPITVITIRSAWFSKTPACTAFQRSMRPPTLLREGDWKGFCDEGFIGEAVLPLGFLRLSSTAILKPRLKAA